MPHLTQHPHVHVRSGNLMFSLMLSSRAMCPKRQSRTSLETISNND